MRAFLLVAGAALAISACGPKQRADNAVATGDNLAAEAIIAVVSLAIMASAARLAPVATALSARCFGPHAEIARAAPATRRKARMKISEAQTNRQKKRLPEQ